MNNTYLSRLIDLLSMENINFQIDDIPTADFCMQTRALRIPSYVFNTNNMTMIEGQICHEVAHALFTPETLFTDHSTYSSKLVNFVEDIRVENLLKEKFLGVGKTLGSGFVKFYEMFSDYCKETELKFTNDLLFIDKVNVYFKSNYFIHANWSSLEELQLVNDLKNLKNYSDLKVMMDRMIDLVNDQKKKQEQEDNNETQQQDETTEKNEEQDEFEENLTADGSDEEQENQEELQSNESSSSSEEKKEEQNIAETQSNGDHIFDDSEYDQQEKFFDQEIRSNNSSNYLFLEEQNAVNIVQEEVIWNHIKKDWCIAYNRKDYINKVYNSIVKNAQLLSIEFNRKKNATNYKNVVRTKNGTLDLSRLASYKTSINLFQENHKFKKQKNHEVVILLDWSGSITSILFELMIQTASLVLFCKKNNIPCRVLAFSDNRTAISKFRSFRKVATNKNSFNCEYVLFELLTASDDVESKIKDFLMLYFARPSYMYLHATPLYDSLLNISSFLKKLYHVNKITSLVILTDGDSNELNRNITTSIFYDNVFDKDSKQIYKNVDFKESVSARDFLFKRLHKIVPNLKILNIFVSEKMNRCTDFRGMLFIKDEIQRENISSVIRKKKYAIINYKDFISIRMFQKRDQTRDNEDVLLNNTKLSNANKKDILKIIQQLNNSLSSIIFKKIAENIA